jgi:voltage-gated potassium channel
VSRDVAQAGHGATGAERAKGKVLDPLREKRVRARRYATRTLVRSSLVTAVILAAYFALPFNLSFDGGPTFILLAGLTVVTALLVWQLRGVVRSPYPRVRTIAALTTALPLFLIVFATAFYISSSSAPDAWSEPLSRLDALYFTVTVFSTVGFGDIVPVSGLARVLVMTQMVADVILVGLVVRVLVAAMRRGIARQGAGPGGPDGS